MSTSATSAQILHHTTVFLSEILSNSDLRHHLFSTFLNKLPSSDEQITQKPLKLASETVENALSTTNPSIKSSSLRLAEKLLLSDPPNPFSSFLLSLIYDLFNRPIDASIKLLEVFQTDASLARLEIAPPLFEELFLFHFLPVLEWYNGQRSRILSGFSASSIASNAYDSDEQSVVVSPSRSLKNMIGNQTSKLKDLEKDYEEILDENCRVFAGYFIEILRNKDGNQTTIQPPVVVELDESKKTEHQEDEKKENETSMKNGRYNPIWFEGDQSGDFNSSNNKPENLIKFPSFYPKRVSPKVLRKQGSTENYISDLERESISNDNLSEDPCSSDSDGESEVKNKKEEPFNSRQGQNRRSKQPIYAESSRSPARSMEDSDNPSGGGIRAAPKDFVCPITSQIFDDPVTLETGQTYERKAIQEWLERGNTTCPITRQELQSIQLPRPNYVLKRLIANWLELNYVTVQSQSEEVEGQENQSNSNRVYRSPSPNRSNRVTRSPSPNKSNRVIRSPSPNRHTRVIRSLSPNRHTRVIIRSPSPNRHSRVIIRSPSPKCVISQATKEGKTYEMRRAITKLCASEVLEESEMAVLQIERLWKESEMEVAMSSLLSKPAVINSFVEILFNSEDPRVLQGTVLLLSDLGSKDNSVIQTLTRVDSDVECIISLFKRGLLEAVVLIYLLHPFGISLQGIDTVDSLLTVINTNEEELLHMCMKPKTAAVLLLGQLLKKDDEILISEVVKKVILENAIESIVGSLNSEDSEERMSAMSTLLRCMLEDGKCRNIIADKAELNPLMESLIGPRDGQWFEIVQFLSELVKLNRRTFNEQVLHIIKDEGTFSSMHTLMTYLHMAPLDRRPIISGLLLQLDLLTEPRKMSMYREEAIDALVSCLKSPELPAAQLAAAEMILLLQGRFSNTGETLARTFLLKQAGLTRTNKPDEIQEDAEEEKMAEVWERRMAYALVSHEFGFIFEALAEGLRSRNTELYSACFLAATWLVHMLTVLPDTGLRGAARTCLLKRFVLIFKSSKDNEEKILSMLALSSFITDPGGLQDMTPHIKDILKSLRELKKTSTLAIHMLKVLSEDHESSNEFWSHKELLQEDCSKHGEVLALASSKDKIFTGHTDGTIKAWTVKSGKLLLLQEFQEHTRAVTSLVILPSVERLYSGSLDRTMRIWSLGNKGMHCEQVHEMKDNVNNLVVSNSVSCFIPQSSGVKVHTWNGTSKLLNTNKYIRCLTLVQEKLYCGCIDNSIQEIDLASGTIKTIQSGSRKLLAKGIPVYAMHFSDGLMYTASSPLDGAAIKIWSLSSYKIVGSLPSTSDVRSMISSSDLIYLGCKGGLVEVWCKKKQTKVETLQTGTNARVISMALTNNEEVLVAGTSDGKIQDFVCDITSETDVSLVISTFQIVRKSPLFQNLDNLEHLMGKFRRTTKSN